ncbi:hypothetical protein RB2150_15151 [Rhodobacteraceae bacterium HTCC2150]|nr:hypothetical protein RB2150_15151 [Rhodobacteraceae bacterium HTCC2150]
MIISHGRKYIFVHIPKTGGTSMALALESRAQKDDIMIGDTPKALKRRRRLKDVKSSGRLWKHSRLIDVYGLISDAEIADFHVFTMVRNPWDRMVSYYNWLKGQGFDNPAVIAAKTLEFSDFIRDSAVVSSLQQNPYSSYVKDRFGQDQCNFYIRLENLSEDVPKLEKTLGVKIGPLPVSNQSKRKQDYRLAYSTADQAWINELCAEDIAQFGYRF